MQLKQKKITLFGFGQRSGPAIAKFLLDHGALLTISERRQQAECLDQLKELAAFSYQQDFAGHSQEKVLASELIVLSPGVPLSHPLLEKAREKKIEIISEIELAYRFLTTPIIAITGTNGKSTVTTLIGQMLSDAGKKVFVGGNLGTPLITAVDKEKREKLDYLVVEVSSFQLAAIEQFKPKIAIILNCTADHLDWHSDFADYAQAKSNLFKQLGKKDCAILNADDQLAREIAQKGQFQKFFFAKERKDKGQSCWAKESGFNCLQDRQELAFSLTNPSLKGEHNCQNAMAATIAANLAAVNSATIQRTLDSFQGLPHRLQSVATINDVEYIDDSKGTNPDALIKAIDSFDRPLLIIVGGKEKNLDYSQVKASLKNKKVRAIICIGESGPSLNKFFATDLPTKSAKNMQEAVTTAKTLAKSGDLVLLSPGTSSLDSYQSYIERGLDFASNVKKIAGGEER